MTLEEQLTDHVSAISSMVRGSPALVDQIVFRLAACFREGGKLLICGNGGSAADAQHLAAEFMNRMRVDRRPWPAIALTTDASVVTSIGNDSDFQEVFARQVEALGQPGTSWSRCLRAERRSMC